MARFFLLRVTTGDPLSTNDRVPSVKWTKLHKQVIALGVKNKEYDVSLFKN
jgi:hypothetical protein